MIKKGLLIRSVYCGNLLLFTINGKVDMSKRRYIIDPSNALTADLGLVYSEVIG